MNGITNVGSFILVMRRGSPRIVHRCMLRSLKVKRCFVKFSDTLCLYICSLFRNLKYVGRKHDDGDYKYNESLKING